jgi:hypothetical protein
MVYKVQLEVEHKVLKEVLVAVVLTVYKDLKVLLVVMVYKVQLEAVLKVLKVMLEVPVLTVCKDLKV